MENLLENKNYLNAILQGVQAGQDALTLVRLGDVLKITALSRSSFYEQIARGLMPPPVKISDRSVAWLISEIKAVNFARIRGLADGDIKTLVSILINARTDYENK